MKHITDREILEARAVLMREIEAGRVTIPEDESTLEKKCRVNWLKEARLEKRKRYNGRYAAFAKRQAIKKGAVPQAGEIALKDWCYRQAEKEGLKWWQSIFRRYRAGKYPNLQIRRVNARVIFVKTQP